MRAVDASVITVTRSALCSGVAPIVFPTVCARLSSKTAATLALPRKLVAGGAEGVVGVTVAGLAAPPTRQVPVVGRAVVT